MHAEFSPSSMVRTRACPGSYRAEKGRPDITTAAAQEGTLAHAVFEALNTNTRPPEAPLPIIKNMEHCRQVVVDIMDELRGENPVLYSEVRVPTGEALFSPADPRSGLIWGTADVVIVADKRIIVLDLKYGRNPVKALNNLQLACYMIGAIHLYGERPRYELGILQPHVAPAPTWWTTGPAIMAGMRSLLVNAIESALNPAADLIPGDHCFFCRAGGDCRVRERYELRQDFGTDPNVLSAEELGDLMDRKKGILKFLESAEARALQLELDGTDIPGWHVGQKRTRERWTAEQEAILTVLESKGIDTLALAPRTLVSPAQARRLVHSPDDLAEFIEKPEGAPALVVDK